MEGELSDLLAEKFGVQNVGSLERVASVALGSFLLWRGIKKPSLWSITAAVAGTGLVLRGATGHCSVCEAMGIDTSDGMPVAAKSGKSISPSAPEIVSAQTIGKSAGELYELWRSPEGLRQIMAHFADVTPLEGPTVTHWKVKGSGPLPVEWDSELTVEQPGQELGWASKPGTMLPNEGSVYFSPAPADRGTEVRVRFRFEPPLGAAGMAISKALGFVPKAIASESLRRFKALAETGEIPTVAGNVSGRGVSDALGVSHAQ